MKRLAFLSLAFSLGSALATAQVTHWRLVKGPGYEQLADNTASPAFWSAFGVVTTTEPGDAAAITLSGGGLAEPVPFLQEGTYWELSFDFGSQAEMNALFPSSTSYTLTLSGGSLGTLTQDLSFGAEQYPNAPFLTGTVFSGLEHIDPTQDWTPTWNDPGGPTAANGLTYFDLFGDDAQVFLDMQPGARSSSTVPANTLLPDTIYEAFLEYTNVLTVAAGGFGIGGLTAHNVNLEFCIRTIGLADVILRTSGSNPTSYTASFPALGELWSAWVNLATTGHSHAIVVAHLNTAQLPLPTGQTLLVSGPQVFLLPAATGPTASWSLLVPNDPTLAGLTVYSQAVHLFGPNTFALSNAQDLTLGL